MPMPALNDIRLTLRGLFVLGVKRVPGTFQEQRKWLSETQWWSQEKLHELQLTLLQSIIRHAFDSVPYYQETMKAQGLVPEDIRTLQDVQKLPIITKDIVREQGPRFVSTKAGRWFVATGYSGGTTGRRLVHKRDLRSVIIEHAFVRRQYDWAGLAVKDRCARMMQREIVSPAREHTRPYAYDAATRELYLSTYHISKETVRLYVNALADYGVKALVAYPSGAFALARLCLDEGLRVSLKAVLTTSETLDPAKREVISRAFECPVYDFYGSGERVCYIHTCERGTYHVLPEYGLTEFLPAGPPNEGSFRVVSTGFWNRAMPLIRYDLGDLVQLGDQPCRCGRAFPVVKRIVGRDSNVMVTPSGKIFGATAIEDMMENILFDMQGMPVLEAQMILEAADLMVLEYVPLDGFCEKDTERLNRLVKEHLPTEFRSSVRPVARIQRTASGKALSLVIRNPGQNSV